MNQLSAATARGRSSGHAMARRALSPPLMLYIVVLSGSIYLLFGSFDDGELAGKSGNSPFYLALIFATYSVMLYQFSLVRSAALEKAGKSLAFLAFICSGFVSLYTAGAVSISVMRYFLYILTILTSLVISTRYSLDEFCENFFWTSLVITVVHLMAYPVLSSRIVYDALERDTVLGITSYAGLFPHKSSAGTFFSLSLMISLVRLFGARNRATVRSSLFLAFAAGVALLAAGAVGRLLFFLISVTAGLIIQAALRRKYTLLLVLSTSLVFAAIAYFWIGEAALIYFLGRSPDLTGRTDVFSFWPRFFFEKPLFGYGFDGFFTDVAGSAGKYLSDLAEGKGFGTFESDYLDLLIQFGAVGGFFFFCMLLSSFQQVLRFYTTSNSRYRFVPVLFLMWSVIGSSLDGGVFIQNSLSCVIVFWLYFGVDRASSVSRGKNSGRLRLPMRPRAAIGQNWRQRLPEELR